MKESNETNKVILIQGALDIEIQYIVDSLKDKSLKKIAAYEFYEGTINGIKVVVSRTLVGTINASVATTLGIAHFSPDIVINQGIAGAHSEALHVGDIVIGKQCLNINSYKMPVKAKGDGSNPFEWELNKRAKEVQSADSKLLDIVYKKLILNSDRQVLIGTLGSGDVFNREYDRISWIHSQFDSLCEDMESIGSYSVCNKLQVPCIGIRIISNNELLLEPLNKGVSIELQKMMVNILNDLFF